MKEIRINVPDNYAELFAEKLSALVTECGGNISSNEKVVDLFDLFRGNSPNISSDFL